MTTFMMAGPLPQSALRFGPPPSAADEAITHDDGPEQDWCELCARSDEPFDEAGAPGMPRDVVRRTVEDYSLPLADWDPAWGPGPRYEVSVLSCGHTLCQLA